jgi:hypothetical protein
MLQHAEDCNHHLRVEHAQSAVVVAAAATGAYIVGPDVGSYQGADTLLGVGDLARRMTGTPLGGSYSAVVGTPVGVGWDLPVQRVYGIWQEAREASLRVWVVGDGNLWRSWTWRTACGVSDLLH